MNTKLFLACFVGVLFFYSCSKKSTTTTGVSKSHWTYNDTTYYGDTTYFAALHPILVSQDSAGNSIYVWFSERPSKNATFTLETEDPITNNYGVSPDSGTCVVEVGNGFNNNFADTYGSIMSSGIVTVTIISGKLKVDFSNLTVANENNVRALLSGTLFEQ
jgi:hypothetical protein